MNKESQRMSINGNNNYQIFTGNADGANFSCNITINSAKRSEFSEYFDNLPLEYKCKAILYIEDLRKKEQQPKEEAQQMTNQTDSNKHVPPAPVLLELADNISIDGYVKNE